MCTLPGGKLYSYKVLKTISCERWIHWLLHTYAVYWFQWSDRECMENVLMKNSVFLDELRCYGFLVNDKLRSPIHYSRIVVFCYLCISWLPVLYMSGGYSIGYCRRWFPYIICWYTAYKQLLQVKTLYNVMDFYNDIIIGF